LIGPTAVGKSSFTKSLSSLVPSLINIDSMQVYSNLPIAAANPSPPYASHSLYGFRDFILDDLLHAAPTKDAELITSVEPNLPSTYYNYSVKRFCASVLESLSSLPASSPCLLCGGSMNYAANVIDNVLCSVPSSPSPCPSSDEAKAWFSTLTAPLATLNELSPDHSIHPSNHRQIRNALLRLHSTPQSSLPPPQKTLTRPLFVVYVDCSDDDLLATRINKRIGEMVER
jgi:tRNA A37 N6-isopentenylltransferase MiaA